MSKKLRDLVHDIQYTHDLTLEEVAKRIGRTRPYLSKVMNREEENDEMYDLITRKFNQPEVIQKPDSQNDYQARLISRLDDDLREIRTTVSELQKILLEVKSGLETATARQQAAFVITQFVSEEVSAIPKEKDEQKRKKLTESGRKEIYERLKAANPLTSK